MDLVDFASIVSSMRFLQKQQLERSTAEIREAMWAAERRVDKAIEEIRRGKTLFDNPKD